MRQRRDGFSGRGARWWARPGARIAVVSAVLVAGLRTALGAATPDVSGQVSLAWIPASSVKLEQVIGDCDWTKYDWADQAGTCLPTTS